ncbi:probable protein arginine N-methyltransferase 3 [Ipomoea triloba]|uniref:probable protein arginine N-methyltransferase 3 n=1 Tax=Ipomoea triloba TaxID=35885 RepID=UPI00125D1E87|nr:probable protein arginine N-methyltransferase 3 [Ipomoea triloba]
MATLDHENASQSSDMEMENGIDVVDEEDQNWDDWEADEEDNIVNSELACLFCDSRQSSGPALFQHCASSHHFDFEKIKNDLHLDFYGCFKLINYIRSEVAENRCWSCRITCKSKQDLQNHLHEMIQYENNALPWEEDKYLKPFLQEDALLYSFVEDDEGEDDTMSVDNNELARELSSFERIKIDDYEPALEEDESGLRACCENGGKKVVASTAGGSCSNGNSLGNSKVKAVDANDCNLALHRKAEDEEQTNYFSDIAKQKIKNVNKNYFGSYSSFGIHREMISDKERTDAYRRAIVENPSLFRGSTVMDVGCGTGILSLFAAQAGASRVMAVEASEKMAGVATQIAKENGLLWNNSLTGVIEVVQGMVEELDGTRNIQPNSVDVLISEWMGYCLLYESMLSSVLLARDKWLKPGGAILPDTATMFVAGFGRGGTGITFWDNVYGFNMSCIGKELAEEASRFPIVDIVDSSDVVTSTAVLQAFDLVTMKTEEMDFTAIVELEPKNGGSLDSTPESKPKTTWCYGLVLWFETGFSGRFCKEMPTNLSTSPYQPKTHWSQTILTFREPVAMSSGRSSGCDKSEAVGTDACPAVRMQSRISIARGIQHRKIDISVEVTAVGPDGRKRSWPGQLFNL